ncbi:MAG: hypothetical protein IH820_10690, partial [Bacteroidetes bacterium]|nr:hypothetical protein [Bacteroidota bacterium]
VLAADASKGRIAIVEGGKVVWEAKIRAIHDLQILDNGNILFQTSWTRLVEMTRDRKVVWKYDSAVMNGNQGKRVEVHAFRRLSGGVTMIAESGPSRIIEVDRDETETTFRARPGGAAGGRHRGAGQDGVSDVYPGSATRDNRDQRQYRR